MAIAADGQLRGGPMTADAARQAPHMATDFVPGRRLAGPQQDGDRARGGDVVDVDRHEAALVVMRVEQGQLLMAVRDVDGVVDVQRHRGRWAGVAGAIGVEHGVAQAHDLAQGRRGDCRKIGGQAAIAIGGHGSLAGWNFCPKPEPSVPL